MQFYFKNRKNSLFIVGLFCICLYVAVSAFQKKNPTDEPNIAPHKKYSASVSDAVELVKGKNGTMGHDMKLFGGKPMVGL